MRAPRARVRGNAVVCVRVHATVRPRCHRRTGRSLAIIGCRRDVYSTTDRADVIVEINGATIPLVADVRDSFPDGRMRMDICVIHVGTMNVRYVCVCARMHAYVGRRLHCSVMITRAAVASRDSQAGVCAGGREEGGCAIRRAVENRYRSPKRSRARASVCKVHHARVGVHGARDDL